VVLKRAYHQGKAERDKVQMEARMMASIDHAHVARIYTVEWWQGRWLLVMEFVSGEDLASKLSTSGPLRPYGLALGLAVQLVNGLAAVWEAGLVHRDVKPANVIVDDHGVAKLIDFGLAVPADSPPPGTSKPKGSAYYVPPERILKQHEDFRGDIYSAGIILFEMLVGQPPFREGGADAIAAAHVTRRVPRVDALRSSVPGPLVSLVAAMTRRRPAERPSSYGELLDEMERVVAYIDRRSAGQEIPSA